MSRYHQYIVPNLFVIWPVSKVPDLIVQVTREQLKQLPKSHTGNWWKPQVVHYDVDGDDIYEDDNEKENDEDGIYDYDVEEGDEEDDDQWYRISITKYFLHPSNSNRRWNSLPFKPKHCHKTQSML